MPPLARVAGGGACVSDEVGQGFALNAPADPLPAPTRPWRSLAGRRCRRRAGATRGGQRQGGACHAASVHCTPSAANGRRVGLRECSELCRALHCERGIRPRWLRLAGAASCCQLQPEHYRTAIALHPPSPRMLVRSSGITAMGHVGSRAHRVRRLFAALLVCLILIAGCADPARTPGHNRGPGFTPRVMCQDDAISNSPTKQGTCSQHGGVREWLRALRS
jgi:hypothetical protein